MKHIDIFMLTWNHFSHTIRAISTLLDVTNYPDYTLIINDNGSSIEMKKYLEWIKMDNRIRVIQHKMPEVSFCQAMNECLKISTSDFIATVQNDMIFINENWLKELVNCLERNPEAGMVGAKLIYPNGTIQHAGASFNSKGEWYHIGRGAPACEFNQEKEVPGSTSAVMIVRRSAIPNGCWNEEYIGAANHNDVEMCCLMRKSGWKIIYCPSSVVVHIESLTFKEDIAAFKNYIPINAKIFEKNCWIWLRDDLKNNTKLYRESITLDEMVTSEVFNSGWHLPEYWYGTSPSWMEADAIITVNSFKTCIADLSLQVLSFYRPRTLEIYSGEKLAMNVIVPTNFININAPIHLAEGRNTVRFHVPDGCERPCDKPELNNPDSRCLSLAVRNIRLKIHV